ncbi:MAG: hypothetical protein AAF585_20740, partial [Verrucomicrobiota bacterium]
GALASREPELADEIFEEFALGEDRGLAALSVVHFYTQAFWDLKFRRLPEEEAQENLNQRRERLIQISAEQTTEKEIRTFAMKRLLDPDFPWDGRDRWIFEHLQLKDAGDLSMISAITKEEPDVWIPKLIALIEKPDRNAHNNAVYLLAEFHLSEARADALKPLLPWLSNPDWSEAPDLSRLRVIQSVDRIDLPEAIPGLLAAAKIGVDFELSDAAAALEHYEVKEAVPILKEALKREKREDKRRRVIASIHALGGFDEDEILSTLETTLRLVLTDEGKEKIRKSNELFTETTIPPEVSIGRYFSFEIGNDESLARALLERVDALAEQEPELAQMMRNVVASSGSEDAWQDLTKSLRDNSLTTMQLLNGLSSRKEPRDEIPDLVALSHENGYAAGFASVLNCDHERMAAIIAEGDAEARIAVLAAARLERDPLPLAEVGKLIDSDVKLLHRAAVDYLTNEDSAEAREYLGPHQFTGTQGYGPLFPHVESRLLQTVGGADGPEESFGILSYGTWGANGHFLVFVQDGKATAYRDFERGRIGKADLNDEQLARLRDYVAKYQVDDLPPLTQSIYDGIQYEYVHVSQTTARRVFMNNPPRYGDRDGGSAQSGIAVYGQLVNLFYDLFDELDLELSYPNGAKILIPHETAKIETVWKSGDDFRVLLANERGIPSWVSVTPDGKLEKAVAAPNVFAIPGADIPIPVDMSSFGSERNAWQNRIDGCIIRSGEIGDRKGIWELRKDQPPRFLAEGWFSRGILTPEGKWCVVAKTLGENWATPNGVVRMKVKTGELFPVELEPADNFDPVAFVPAHKKVLLRRKQDSHAPGIKPNAGPIEAEYHLLDPETGALERVQGEFGMLAAQTIRQLQATDEPHVFWAVVAREDDHGIVSSHIGHYDTREFTFESIVKVEGVILSSMSTWIDEEGGYIYSALNGDLVQIEM